MPQPNGGTNEHDVALAKIGRGAARDAVLARGAVGGLWIIASAVPLLVLKEIVDALAGKTTIVDVKIAVALGAVFTISVLINVAASVKLSRQRATILDLRGQMNTYEGIIEGQRQQLETGDEPAQLEGPE